MAASTEYLRFDAVTPGDLPDWLPVPTRHYLVHIGAGVSIRALARSAGVHASTILRQIRRTEQSRDDPLIDTALRDLERSFSLCTGARDGQGPNLMPNTPKASDDTKLLQEGARVLRRLCETGAVLAVAAEMEKAVVVRYDANGTSTRTAVTDSAVASMLALREWISTDDTGRIRRYSITGVGRSALRDQPELADVGGGFAEMQAPFDPLPMPDVAPKRRRIRYGLAESPLIALARRKDRDGKPFLGNDLVSAGERLRENFELSQMGPDTTQNWEQFLTAGVDCGTPAAGTAGTSASDARARVAAALGDLGPGLADVVLRCCCYLEGLEAAEKKLGWSARSGKVVLRIALMRLKRHYEETTGPGGLMIG